MMTYKTIYLTRHGESEMNVMCRIGGNSSITHLGQLYGDKLSQYMKEEVGVDNFVVWTSQLKRAVQTAHKIDAPKYTWKELNEIDAGKYDGMTYEDIEAHYPEDFLSRKNNKYYYKYPDGESYADVVKRLEPLKRELVKQDSNVLVVSHKAVIRCLLAYFLNIPPNELPNIDVPIHTLFKLCFCSCSSVDGGCTVEKIELLVANDADN